MASQTNRPAIAARASVVESWVWPMTAAIVLGGSIVFWSLAALFWLATHPAEKSVVIWMTAAEGYAAPRGEASVAQATAGEERCDAEAH